MKETETAPAQPQTPSQDHSSLAIVAMVLGAFSLTGPGLFLGIPAIVVAIIALKTHAAGRGLSIVGLVTGIISTLFSLLFIAMLIFAIIWESNHPGDIQRYENHAPSQQSERPRSSEV